MRLGLVSMIAFYLVGCGGEVASLPPPVEPVPAPSAAAPAAAPASVPTEKQIATAEVEEHQAKAAPPAPQKASTEVAYPNRQSIEALDRLPPTLRVVHDGRASAVTLQSDDLFDPGDATLKPQSAFHLAPLVTALRLQSGKRIIVRAYTDGFGDRTENKRLSSDRAKAVREALVAKGVDADVITAEGLGAEHPIGDDATIFGRAENRRIQVLIRPAR